MKERTVTTAAQGRGAPMVLAALCAAMAGPACGGGTAGQPEGGVPHLEEPCLAATGCSGDLVCAEGLCRRPCGGPGDCGGGLGCRDGACLPCADDAECTGEYACSEDLGCLAWCRTDADCKAGASCTGAGECVVLRENGAACARPDDCQSGFCAAGVCCESACSGGCETCAGATPGSCEPDPRPECTVSVPAQAATVAAALDLVADGGLIEITADLTESVVIDGAKDVHLRGTTTPRPRLVAAAAVEAALTITGTGAVEVEHLEVADSADGVRVLSPVPVTLRDLLAQDNEVGITVDHHGGWTPEALVRIEQSDVWGNASDGLAVSSAPVEVVETRFAGNRRNVRVEGVHSFRLLSSVVAQANGKAGLVVRDSDHVTIEGSVVWENYPLGGIWMLDTTDSEIRNAVVQGNGAFGVVLQRTSNVTVEQVVVREQFDPLYRKFAWSSDVARVDVSGLNVPSLGDIPMSVQTPVSVAGVFGDDYWIGNGVEINDGYLVVLHDVFIQRNEGSGVLVRDSSGIIIMSSDLFLNQKNGVTAVSSDVWVKLDGIYNNYSMGVQAEDGNVWVDQSSLSGNFQDSEGKFGVGFLAHLGDHLIEDSTLCNDPMVGFMISNGTTVHVSGTDIWGGTFAYATESGPGVTLGPGNDFHCEVEATQSCFTTYGAPAPAPPPAVPLDP